MNVSEHPRELVVSQGHLGTTLLAGIIGLAVTCLAATLAMGVVWQIASWSGWLACLILPAVILVLVSGSLLLQWCERFLPRLWPSGTRLMLNRDALTLSQRRNVLCEIVWDEPFTVLRWRIHGLDPVSDSASPPGWLCLACQLKQKSSTISVYAGCSALDWRRVAGWKHFPLLEGAWRPSQTEVLKGLVTRSGLRRQTAPSHRGVSSLPQGDPKILWPAERERHRGGWALAFDDFCALMAIVERSVHAKEWND